MTYSALLLLCALLALATAFDSGVVDAAIREAYNCDGAIDLAKAKDWSSLGPSTACNCYTELGDYFRPLRDVRDYGEDVRDPDFMLLLPRDSNFFYVCNRDHPRLSLNLWRGSQMMYADSAYDSTYRFDWTTALLRRSLGREYRELMMQNLDEKGFVSHSCWAGCADPTAAMSFWTLQCHAHELPPKY